jgi:putative redox protein
MLDRIDVEIGLSGALTPEQRAKLMEIAGKCPVHRTLKSEINIRLRTAPGGSLGEGAQTKIQSLFDGGIAQV